MTRRAGASQRRRLPRTGRTPQPRILVLCGAQRTEPDYLSALKREARSSGVTIRSVGIDPARLVRHAKRLLLDGEFDAAWCVVDKDEFDLDSAARAARQSVDLAVSNPCFELWLLLHHSVQAAYATCVQISERLATYVPTYDKSRLDFRHFKSSVDTAIERARQLENQTDSPYPNPSTGVWRLADIIRRPHA